MCAKHKEEKIKGRYWFFVKDIEFEEGESPEITFLVALPINHKGQEVSIGEIFPEPVEIIESGPNRIVHWHIDKLEGKEQVYFYYDFEVTPSEVKSEIEPEKIEEYDTASKDYKRYTGSEEWIEITDEIKTKAIEIVGDEKNRYKQAKLLFDWVIENMAYEYPDIKSRGVKKSFKKLKGDCGEFSMVFCALARSLGIPARTVTCVWFTGSGHQWAEILLPPYGWIPVDTSVAQLLKPGYTALTEEEIQGFMESRKIPVKDPAYLFGNLYPNRLIVSIGNNIEVHSDKTGLKKIFKFLQPGGYTGHPPSVELKGLSKNTVATGFYLFGENCSDLELAKEKLEKKIAVMYLNKGLFEKAETGLLKKLEENKKDASAWLQLGQAYMNQDKIDNAIEAFKNAIEGEAGSTKHVIEVWARNLLGNCYDLKEQRELAVKQYQKVIESNIDYDGSLEYAKKYLKEPYKREE